MKTGELRKKDKKELEIMVKDLKKKLNNISFKKTSNQLKNVNEIKNSKKEIARILTILRENK